MPPYYIIGLKDLLYTFLLSEYLASSISFISFCDTYSGTLAASQLNSHYCFKSLASAIII
jgi:hypothetical protein